MQHAETIKKEHGCCLPNLTDHAGTISVPGVASRAPKEIHKKSLAQVIQARYAELFELVSAEIRRSGLENLIASGIVLTGGASKVEGSIELAESICQMPVRAGLPENISGLVDVRDNPGFATGVGLLIHGMKAQQSGVDGLDVGRHAEGLWARMKHWFNGNF